MATRGPELKGERCTIASYNNARIKAGWTKEFPIDPTVASEIKSGMFLILASSKAALPSTMSDAGTTAQNQEAAHDVFLGVAMDAHVTGDTKQILVAAEGDGEFPCTALGQAYDVGQYFGLEGTGTAAAVGVSDTVVIPVATANLAVGRLYKAAASGATTVSLRFAGVLSTAFAGSQTMA